MAPSPSRINDDAVYQQSPNWPKRCAALGVALALVCGLASLPALAEISTGGERQLAQSQSQGQGQTPTRVGSELAGDVRARCWQEGREILSEADFTTAAIAPGLREQAINLGGGGRQAVLVPLGDTFCLLTVRP
jgi:hypothetical protein